MDAPRGMNDQEADKLLHDLFQQSGTIKAPDGLDARILQRIAVTAQTAPVQDKPLLPKWAWIAGGLLLVGFAFLPAGGAGSGWTTHIPSFGWEKILASPWLMMGSATCAALLGLDAFLNKRRRIEHLR